MYYLKKSLFSITFKNEKRNQKQNTIAYIREKSFAGLISIFHKAQIICLLWFTTTITRIIS